MSVQMTGQPKSDHCQYWWKTPAGGFNLDLKPRSNITRSIYGPKKWLCSPDLFLRKCYLQLIIRNDRKCGLPIIFTGTIPKKHNNVWDNLTDLSFVKKSFHIIAGLLKVSYFIYLETATVFKRVVGDNQDFISLRLLQPSNLWWNAFTNQINCRKLEQIVQGDLHGDSMRC